MGNVVAQNVARLPQILRPGVVLFFEKLADQDIKLTGDLVAPVSRLVACSEFAAKILLREFDWFTASVASFSRVADDRELDRFVKQIAASDADVAAVKSELRRFRNRHLLRILWREVHQLADLDAKR